MIPPGFLQELLSRVDIVDVVSPHVELKRSGSSWMGLCPFHGEKSPSFSVVPAKQFYYCFGCGAGGDAIRFLTEHLGMSFVEAVRDLAGRVGLSVPEEQVSPEERERRDTLRQRRLSITEVLERAAAFYRAQLKGSPQAIDYLKRRGLTGAIAARFGLGYAPPGWKTLAGVFPSYDDPLLEEAGLVRQREASGDGEGEGESSPDATDRGRYDWFRHRVMFPIRGADGQVIGFGGRVLDDSRPKYMNSPETPVFSKGRELYGLFEARQALRDKGCVLVVEGYMDVVALAQSGFGNAVATLGTACTADHVQKLFRFTDVYARMVGGRMWLGMDPPAQDSAPQDGVINVSSLHASPANAFEKLLGLQILNRDPSLGVNLENALQKVSCFVIDSFRQFHVALDALGMDLVRRICVFVRQFSVFKISHKIKNLLLKHLADQDAKAPNISFETVANRHSEQDLR
ncbi:MAG: hypothetical protein RLZZ341_409, partial [Pseudomonadota bacterium]